MKSYLNPEMMNLIKGGSCNCVARSLWINRDAMPNNMAGAISSVGTAAHASVCKDMIANMTYSDYGVKWDVKFVGCYPQDDMGMQKYLRQ